SRGRDLRPAPWRGAEIDDALARLQDAMLVVDFDQLEGRSRAPAFALRGGDIRIVELPLEPALGRCCPPGRRLETHAHLPGAAERPPPRPRAAAGPAFRPASAPRAHVPPPLSPDGPGRRLPGG